MAATPWHLEKRLRQALDRLLALARERGLAEAFREELHFVKAAVREALESRDRACASRADREIAVMMVRLRRTPVKRLASDGRRSGPAMGRGRHIRS